VAAGEAGQGPVDMGPTAEVPTAEYLTKRIPAVLHTTAITPCPGKQVQRRK